MHRAAFFCFEAGGAVKLRAFLGWDRAVLKFFGAEVVQGNHFSWGGACLPALYVCNKDDIFSHGGSMAGVIVEFCNCGTIIIRKYGDHMRSG